MNRNWKVCNKCDYLGKVKYRDTVLYSCAHTNEEGYVERSEYLDLEHLSSCPYTLENILISENDACKELD